MRYHKAHLTRRLILDTSADSEMEENMVEWLRVSVLVFLDIRGKWRHLCTCLCFWEIKNVNYNCSTTWALLKFLYQEWISFCFCFYLFGSPFYSHFFVYILPCSFLPLSLHLCSTFNLFFSKMYSCILCIVPQDVGMPADYINKLARMFQDIKVSEDLNQEFKKHYRSRGDIAGKTRESSVMGFLWRIVHRLTELWTSALLLQKIRYIYFVFNTINGDFV